jgi:hypothetical protein
MRFYGSVGYATSEEASPGVWTDVITEKSYYGDVIRQSRRLDTPPTVPPTENSDISLENSFSIMADEAAYANYTTMRYVVWEGVHWRISNVEVRRPRLILTVGGIWNGRTA